MEAAYDLKNDG